MSIVLEARVLEARVLEARVLEARVLKLGFKLLCIAYRLSRARRVHYPGQFGGDLARFEWGERILLIRRVHTAIWSRDVMRWRNVKKYVGNVLQDEKLARNKDPPT